MAPEFNGVEVRGVPDAKHAYEFVLGAVKAALASVGFNPDVEIEHGAIGEAAGCHELTDVTPIHADEVDGTINRDLSRKAERFAKKTGEGRL